MHNAAVINAFLDYLEITMHLIRLDNNFSLNVYNEDTFKARGMNSLPKLKSLSF